MKILKVKPDIPDPLSYLEVIQKYQNWNEIKSFALDEEHIRIRDNEVFFWETSRGSHNDICINCRDKVDIDCEILNYEMTLSEAKEQRLNDKLPTMKRCPALIDLFNTGVIIPAWEDMIFEATIIDNDKSKLTLVVLDKDNNPIATSHTKPQVDFIGMNFDVSHNHSVKFTIPYRIFSKELIMHKSIFWLGELPFRVVEGIQDTQGVSSININTIWKLETGQRWTVKKGTPMFYIMEIPRDSVNAKHDIVQYEDLDWDKLKQINMGDREVRLTNGYRNNQRKMLK